MLPSLAPWCLRYSGLRSGIHTGPAAALLIAFAQFVDSARGLVGGASPAEIQVPLAELFLWVQVLHSMGETVPGALPVMPGVQLGGDPEVLRKALSGKKRAPYSATCGSRSDAR